MILPRKWTFTELAADAATSRAIFRKERLVEPLEQWRKSFKIHEEQFKKLFDHYGLEDPMALTSEQLVALVGEKLFDALRYITAPPISADDLKVLAEASLAPGAIKANPQQAQRIVDTIKKAVDPCRFPWIAKGKRSTRAERSAAILASAALITAQRVSTDRRSDGKDGQESAVKKFLIGCEFTQVQTRVIRTLADAPDVGEFCGESLVGSRKADVAIRLFDGRLMLLECKVSNSSTNSVKRINNDAQVKASVWHREFGTNQVVPAAILSGVFKALNLEQAQSGGLSIFWEHQLSELKDFIQSTRH